MGPKIWTTKNEHDQEEQHLSTEMNNIRHFYTIRFCPDNNGSRRPKALLCAGLQLAAVASGSTKGSQWILVHKWRQRILNGSRSGSTEKCSRRACQLQHNNHLITHFAEQQHYFKIMLDGVKNNNKRDKNFPTSNFTGKWAAVSSLTTQYLNRIHDTLCLPVILRITTAQCNVLIKVVSKMLQ